MNSPGRWRSSFRAPCSRSCRNAGTWRRWSSRRPSWLRSGAGWSVNGSKVVWAAQNPYIGCQIDPAGTAVKELFMLRDDINNAVKDAMRAKDERKLSTLRMVNSTIKNADIEARAQGKPPLSDAELLGVFQKMIKQRQESVELYDKGGRAELAAQEREEIAVISAYLPKQMSEDDVKAAIASAIASTGAAGMKDMGKVIGVLKAKYAGQMDFGKASGLVKAALSS